MRIAVLKERRAHEKRVAASPETVRKMVDLGLQVCVESNAGEGSFISDDDFKKAGAEIGKDLKNTLKGASIILKVQRPFSAQTDEENEADLYPEGATLIGLLNPLSFPKTIADYNAKKLNALALEMTPRITRAQNIDVLSSQSNLAGYRAVIEASNAFHRAFPLMMTAAGTVPPARVLVLGAGVAGLQAIATARRLGAIVSAFDVRAAAKEQVESLGAKFIQVEMDDANSNQEAQGGYAQETSKAYQKRQADAIHDALKKTDIAISTALIPGKPAPILITEKMLKDMRTGSVVVDLAVEAGGNCAGSVPEKVVTKNGVTIMGYTNMPSRIAVDATSLYARNVFNLLKLIVNADTKEVKLDSSDELINGILLTTKGKITHPRFQKNTL